MRNRLGKALRKLRRAYRISSESTADRKWQETAKRDRRERLRKRKGGGDSASGWGDMRGDGREKRGGEDRSRRQEAIASPQKNKKL